MAVARRKRTASRFRKEEGLPSSRLRSSSIPLSWPARLLFAAILVGVGLLAGFALDEPGPPLPPAVEEGALTVPLVSDLFDGRREAEVTLVWGPSQVVVSPGWSGTVTRVGVEPGGTVVEGDRPVAVDSVDRIALALAEPLYRPLSSGVRGEDVAELRAALVRLGYLESVADNVDRFDAELASAVSQLSRDLGFPRTSSIIDPSWVVWLPSTEVSVAEVYVRPGSPAPPAGALLFTLAADLEAARVSGDVEAGGYVLVIPGVDASFRLRGSEVDPASLSDLVEVLKRVGADPESDAPVFGEIRLAEPVEVVTVPASAVGVSADGSACLWTGALGLQRTRILGSRLGVVSVEPTPTLTPGTEVLVDPGEELRAQC